VTSTSTYPPLLALGAALRATAARGFFFGFFFLGFGGAVVSSWATVGAASGFAAALFLLNEGKPNQPLD
jgi:hypothetical protein